MDQQPSALQFVPFNTFIDPGIWSEILSKKLIDLQLDESPKFMWGSYVNSDAAGLSCRHSIDFNSLSSCLLPQNTFRTHGELRVFNSLESFKAADKQSLLNLCGQQVWDDIVNGKTSEDSSLLNRFVFLCFVDIKRYQFTYWLGYPALSHPDGITQVANPLPIGSAYSEAQVKQLQKQIVDFCSVQHTGYFLVLGKENESFQLLPLSETVNLSDTSGITLGFCDPSTNECHPGWPLRNLLAFWSTKTKSTSVRVLCWRNRYHRGVVDCSHSLVLDVNWSSSATSTLNCPKVTGWELNNKGSVGPRYVDMSRSLDPTKLAENALKLNLQLMRWRLVPELDLDVLSNSKCLLFGAGTLGSNVARCLLGWGVTRISFVDNGKVSFNNPTRQSLYTFADCLDGGKRKAEAAAANLKKLYPNADANGYDLSIPMPGHIVSPSEVESIRRDVELISDLIRSHDVIFLLTDTRESRWLPTLLSTYLSKLTFSVALGFDSFLVVRHGFGRPPFDAAVVTQALSTVTGDQLGCYFCSDVVAPGNSLKDRTLDQQCTVTRPGGSYIAAALAVELMASVLQHPQKGLASAESSDSNGGCLSVVPHQIRGFLSRFEQMTPAVSRFSCCIACSDKVVAAYEQRGFDFLLEAFQDPTSLENLTGLTELHANTNLSEVWELSDNESIKSID